MVNAYVLINITSSKNVKNVLNQIRAANGVKQAHLVTGLHDVVAFIEGGDLNKLRDVVTDDVLPIGGVSKTVTLIAVDGE